MLAVLASLGAKLALGKIASNAKADALAAGKWLSTLNGPQLLCLILAVLLAVDHVGLVLAHRHSAKVEAQLAASAKALGDTRAAFDTTVANYRAAAETARAADAANKVRVEAQQKAINERTSDDYEKRLADARAVAGRLRAGTAAAHSGGAAATPVPGLPAAPGGAAQAAEDGFSIDDRLTATEQGIQLDELIKWIRALHAIDVNGKPDGAKK